MYTVALPFFASGPARRPRRRASVIRTAVFAERLEPRRLMAFAASINFQPAGAAVPAGYVADSGAVYGSRGNGLTFGWNVANTTATRDRNSAKAPDQRYDTLTHTQLRGDRTWEIAVPNGPYRVRIVGGDPNFTDSTIRFNAENMLVVAGMPTTQNPFVDGFADVTVSDGKLTITNASGASNNKINFIEITSPDANPGAKVSVAATDSTASEAGANTGKFTITRTGPTTAALLVNYVLGGSATNGTDYNALAGNVTIPAGKSSVTITVTPKNDGLAEGDENVVLTVTGSAAYIVTTPTATVTIADDDDTTSTPSGDWPKSFTAGPNIPKRRWEAGGIAMDGKIWAFGGWMSGSSTGTQQVDVYDIASNTWSTLKKYMPVPHSHSAQAADPANHTIYFAGGLFGSYPGVPTNRVWKFNTQTLQWTELPAMNENHSSGGLALVNNKLHYLGGVEDDRETNTGSHVVLDLDNLAAGWKTETALPDARDHFSTVVLNNKIYVIGGEFGHDIGHVQTRLVHRYDPIGKTWERLGDMPIAKSHAETSTFVTPSGKIIMAGGQIGDWKSTDDVSMYDPSTDTWSTLGKLPKANQGPIIQQVGNKVFIIAGNEGNGPVYGMWIGELS
jgi:N-acetylneuraminic acid mutarotase